MVEDLGSTTSVEVMRRLDLLAGRDVVDVGCGDMTFATQMAGCGANVLAVDPDPVQGERNRAADPIENVRFAEGGAGAIPADDDSVDGVVFSFSLHHVPGALHAEAFADIGRVLRSDGYLCVIEPTACPLYEVMNLFHDEDEVKRVAQESLKRYAAPMFETHARYRYSSEVVFESFEAFVGHFMGNTFNPDYCEADVRRPEVEAAFERLGGKVGTGADGYRFDSPKVMALMRGLRK